MSTPTHIESLLNADGFVFVRMRVVLWGVRQGAEYTTQREGPDVEQVHEQEQPDARQEEKTQSNKAGHAGLALRAP